MTRHLAAAETEWIRKAACGGEPVEVFFLADRERYKPGRFDRAEEICAECPVRSRCDNYATRRKERWGVWAAKDRGEAKHAQRVANEEAKALQDAGLPAPGDEGPPGLRVALADEAAGGRPDALGA